MPAFHSKTGDFRRDECLRIAKGKATCRYHTSRAGCCRPVYGFAYQSLGNGQSGDGHGSLHSYQARVEGERQLTRSTAVWTSWYKAAR